MRRARAGNCCDSSGSDIDPAAIVINNGRGAAGTHHDGNTDVGLNPEAAIITGLRQLTAIPKRTPNWVRARGSATGYSRLQNWEYDESHESAGRVERSRRGRRT